MEFTVKPFKPTSVSVGVIEFGSLSWVGDSLVTQDEYRDSASYTPKIWLSVEFGEFCPLNCVHCAWRKQISRDVLTIEQLLDILKDYFKSGLRPDMVSISGKEPSVTKNETLKIAELAKSYGIKVVMMTSGIGFTREFIKDTRGLIDYLDLSIDGDEKHHELIRGKGMFKRALKALDIAVEYGTFEQIGIISIASSINYKGIAPLVEIIDSRYPDVKNIRHTIGMYHGLPGDNLLLDLDETLYTFRSIESLDRPVGKNPVLFLYYPNYTHFLFDFLKETKINFKEAKVCKKTGFLVYERKNLQFVPLHYNLGILLIPRLSSDGYLFMSSNHLVIAEPSHRYAIGDALKNPISKILESFFESYRTEFFDFTPLTKAPEYCFKSCSYYEICGGGDRLLGLFLGDEKAYDPFCPRIKEAREGITNIKRN